MAHRIIFYPVGNGDTSQIILENGKRILMDYRHRKKTEEGEGPEINLKARLKQELKDAGRDSFDVVAFTHADTDHIENSTEFFELRHATKYQGNGRIKIDTLWVPAAMVLEMGTNGQQSSEFVIWRQEARHRLKEGKGIRVFSKPEKLKDWLEENDLTLESRRHLITDAGQLAPEFDIETDGVEFFCHSPFIKHVDDGDDLRNAASLIFNVRFRRNGTDYDYLAVGDSEWSVLEDIVTTTKTHGNMDRLAWDLYNIPHHCSYLALSDEKGEFETTPKPLVEELLLSGKEGAYIVSSSCPILDTKEGREQTQPPHIQAKKCYETYRKKTGGAKFLVTMEEPNATKPEPLEFKVDNQGLSLARAAALAASVIISKPAPRAG
ncbi:hypothetical protein AQ910_05785 [Burkholderia pseudomallei]|uniref:hypothetical protein n=1 Tax=Burkholderia pseudomallei TaxID=28450 RepID=UPI000538B524|nr:hypothetical protein [Burkholderia pseudomallei]AJX20838.1 hypothetical protein BG17_1375 [Burkholderia pseudomallei MSHR491]KGW83022.1 hypothetical protein Y034_777 [Burkholderia pseudomallei MSHR449]KGX74261.1 hypothetical protein Y033_642 [Burkholderia pseudomallei MSHR435]ONC06113.1 hypothetical protein AQ910_05785 [Burkholderia pseudomallei]